MNQKENELEEGEINIETETYKMSESNEVGDVMGEKIGKQYGIDHRKVNI